MFEGRSIEFFEAGDKGLLAIRNLTIFIGLLVGSVVVIAMAFFRTLTEGIFAIYMLSCGGVYGFGKWQDESTARNKANALAEPDVTTTTINQPDKVNVAGDAVTKTVRKKK